MHAAAEEQRSFGANSSAHTMTWGSRFSACCTLPGRWRSASISPASASSSRRPRSLASVAASVNSATSWVVKALVEATPISAPARV